MTKTKSLLPGALARPAMRSNWRDCLFGYFLDKQKVTKAYQNKK
jgi:hypothetical protein